MIWQCISIKTKTRNVNLIIKNEQTMLNLLFVLINALDTVDGSRHSAERLYGFEQDREAILQKCLMKYKILKIRMKISYQAFLQTKSVKQLFLETILKSFMTLFMQNKIPITVRNLI